jgi:hypothetical protein
MLENIPVYTGGEVANGQTFTPQQLTHVSGYNKVNRELNARRQIQLAEATDLWAKFLAGRINPFLMREAMNPTEDFAYNELNRRCPHIFNEVMTRSDFTNLTTYVLDRLMLENYPTFPKTYDIICRIHANVKDFRIVERWVTDNGEGAWQRVGETAGFNRTKVDTGKYSYQVYKYEKGDQISWEAVINDDMGMFTDLPKRLALGGVRTLEQFYLGLIANATGPHSSFYGTAITASPSGAQTIKNIIDTSAYSDGSYTGANNPPLNVISLILAVGIFMNQMTAEGRPIDISTDVLNVVVGDGILYQKLMNIINTNQIVSALLGGSRTSGANYPDIVLQAKNWISGRINPVYAPEIRNVMATNGVTHANASTSWWLFAKPGGARPAIELGFLTGYETPQLYRKLANTVRISGGGSVDEFGDFETMATEFKGLEIFGGTRMDPRMTMASNGTGS